MKNYEELLKKYKQNQMSPEEKADFERELKQAATLFDYLMEQEDLDITSPEENQSEQPVYEENVHIKKKINRRILRLALLITAVVTALISCGLYFIPKAIDAYYYNPMEHQVIPTSVEDYGKAVPSDFALYQKVDSQVNLFKDCFGGATVQKTGPAKYQINLSYFNEFSGNYSNSNLTIEKGKQTSVPGYSNQTTLIYGNSIVPQYADVITQGDEITKSRYNSLAAEIARLPDSSWVNVSLQFGEQPTIAELKQLMEKNPKVKLLSANIYANPKSSEKPGITNSNYGIRFSKTSPIDTTYAEKFKKELEKKYPGLLLDQNQLTLDSSEDDLIQYVTSSLQYLIDHQEDSEDQIRDSENSSLGDVQVFNKKYVKGVINQLNDGDLRFQSINVAIPKAQFKAFVEQKNFYYVTLKDISLLSLNWRNEEANN